MNPLQPPKYNISYKSKLIIKTSVENITFIIEFKMLSVLI